MNISEFARAGLSRAQGSFRAGDTSAYQKTLTETTEQVGQELDGYEAGESLDSSVALAKRAFQRSEGVQKSGVRPHLVKQATLAILASSGNAGGLPASVAGLPREALAEAALAAAQNGNDTLAIELAQGIGVPADSGVGVINPESSSLEIKEWKLGQFLQLNSLGAHDEATEVTENFHKTWKAGRDLAGEYLQNEQTELAFLNDHPPESWSAMGSRHLSHDFSKFRQRGGGYASFLIEQDGVLNSVSGRVLPGADPTRSALFQVEGLDGQEFNANGVQKVLLPRG